MLSSVSYYRVEAFLLHRVLGRKFKIRHVCPIVFPLSFIRTFWNTTVSRHFPILTIIQSNRVRTDDLINFNWLFVYSDVLKRGLLTSVSCSSNYQSRAPSAIMSVVYTHLFSSTWGHKDPHALSNKKNLDIHPYFDSAFSAGYPVACLGEIFDRISLLIWFIMKFGYNPRYHCLKKRALWEFIIKFGYNACCYMLKERALWEFI